jgi:hypothetical protein
MKNLSYYTIFILMTFTLEACGAMATPTPSTEEALVDVYTAVAMTFSAQSNKVADQPTSTQFPLATSTPFVLSTPTLNLFPTATYPWYSTTNSCNNSTYVSDMTIPDGTLIAPGETFEKTWKLKNTGSCAWDEDYLLTFYSGDVMYGEDATIDGYVASGTSGEVSVTLTAPDTEGTYTGYWILADSSGNSFGTTFYVQIVVSSSASTSTPTPTTISAEETFTSIPTSTSTSTSTPTPTEDGEEEIFTSTSSTSTPTETPTPMPSEPPTLQTLETENDS